MSNPLSSLSSRAGHLPVLPNTTTKLPAQAKAGGLHGHAGASGDLRPMAKSVRTRGHADSMNMAPRTGLSLQRPQASQMGPEAGQLPVPSALLRSVASGASHAGPATAPPPQHAAVKKNLPSFVEAFNGRGGMDRTFEPQHFVDAMGGLSKGTRLEGRVAEEMARNPDWGKQMQQRWNTLRSSVADARDDGNTQVPSLQEMVAKRPKLFVRFMLTGEVNAKVPGQESTFDRLMKPLPQATESGNAPASPATPPQHAPAPLRTQSGNRPQPAAQPRPQPAAHGAENADPNVPRPSPQAAHEKNLQPFLQSFKSGDMNRDFAPKHMLAAMVELARGTDFKDAVSNKMASDPKWGQKMSENWSALRQAVGQARQAGGSSVPSLARIVGDQQGRDDLIRFLATGQGMERLLPQPPAPRPQPRPRPEPQPRPQPQVQAQPRPATQSPARPTAAHDTQALRQAEEIVRRGEPSPPDRRDTDREAAQLAEHYHERPSKLREDEVYASSMGSYKANLATYNQARALLEQARAPQSGPAAPSAAQVAADKARQAELANARTIVAEGRPDYYTMYQEASARVDYHNSHLSMYEPEDQVTESVDFAAIQKDFDQKLARFEKAKGIIDAAARPEPTHAEVRAEARTLAEQAYRAEVSEARETVKRGPVTYNQVLGWAKDAARQNYMIVGSQHLNHEAIARETADINQAFNAAEQLLANPLTNEQVADRIDAQMAKAEQRVRQRPGEAGPGR